MKAASASVASDVSRYQARETTDGSGDLAKFKGGHAGYVVVPVGTIVLVAILLIVLL